MEIKPTEDSYLDEIVGGKYKLVEKIGQGGMGVVYKGVNEKLGQRVAVKFLSRKLAGDESIVMRFLNEARSYCRVVHPNAVTLLDYGQHDDGTLYIITEFIDGKSLTDTLKEVGPLAPDEAMSVALQVCEVLSAAHREGVIHRDLKLDNLMLIPSSRGRYAVKVLDFGIAKIVDEENGPTTETGSVFGTPEFMSPEQARGDTADPRSDLYALGIILFYTLTGKLPFRGKNKLVVLNKQLNADPPRPSTMRKGIDVPPRLEAVILKLLNKDPDARYESADELAEALEELHVPGGMNTAKIGLKVSKEDSSPEIRLNTLRFGDLSESTEGEDGEVDEPKEFGGDEPDPLGDTVAQFGEREFDDSDPPPLDLESIEMARERTTSHTFERDAETRRFKLIAIVAVALVAVLAAMIVISSDEPSGKGMEGMEDVLATGQVLGMLAAAEESLAEGQLDEAARSLAATDMWLSDDKLPEQGAERRRALRRSVAKLETWRAQFDAALDAGECADARRLLGSIRDESRGVADVMQPLADVCEDRDAKSGEPDEPRVVPSAGQPSTGDKSIAEKPVAAESTKPAGKDSPTNDSGPSDGSTDGQASDDAPTGEPPREAATSNEDGSPTVGEALEEFAKEQDAAGGTESAGGDSTDNKKTVEETPDGMALPPKSLDDDSMSESADP
jgi:serine/threonine-protein kinase